MEKIYYQDTLIAIRMKTIASGSVPITDGSEPLQLVTLKHPKGAYLKAHLHTPKKRQTETLQECLIVRKGKIKIDLYTPQRVFFKYVYLGVGEVLILVQGGYGIHILKDSELIEVKNGPFIEDKVLINP